MSKIKLTGSNSGYVEIDSAADAGNLTLSLPTSGTRLLSNTDNVFSGITTTGQLDINGSIDVSSTSVFNDDLTLTGASYNVVWDKSDNQLEFADNAKISLGSGGDMQLYHDGNHTHLHDSGDGVIYLRTNMLQVNNAANNQTFADFSSSAVNLYSGNSRKFQTTNTGAVVTGICTATSFSGSGEGLTRTTQLSHRNLVINGDMRIAQRGSSFTANGSYGSDRFKTSFGAGGFNTQNVSDAPAGFDKSVKIIQTSYGSASYKMLQTYIEGHDIVGLGWGASGAKSATLSFYVKGSVTGTYGVTIQNAATGGSRVSYVSSYTINSANTWEFKTVTITGPTSYTWYTDTQRGIGIIFSLGSTPYATSTLNQWQVANVFDVSGGVDLSNNSGATLYVTGVQFEPGEQSTPFEYRSYTEELARCQRYFAIFPGRSGGIPFWQAYTGSNQCSCSLPIPYNMRTTPTPTDKGTGTSTTTGYCYNSNGAQVNSRYANNNAPILSCGGYAPSGLGLIMGFGSHQSGTNDVTVASWNGSSPGIFLDAEIS